MGNGLSHNQKGIRRQNKRPTIGFIIVNTSRGWEQLQWLGVVDAARERDANLICFPGGELRSPYGFTAQANVLYNLVSAERVDGLVLWLAGFDNYVDSDEVAEFCAQYQLPIVSVEDTVAGVPGVLMDNYQAMQELMLHLIEGHGYRRIAFIRHLSQGHFGFEERYRAYADALTQHDIPDEANLVSPPFGPEDPGSLAKLASWLQAERITECEAVVAHSDRSALFALPVLQSSGIRIPADLTLTGFDDIAESGFVTPSLTTVRPPFYEMGRKAVEIMLALLAGEEVPPQVVLPSKLVIRQSCGCLGPVVERAAAGPVITISESFEAAVTARREEILAGMIQAAGSAAAGLDPAWAERLLDDFTAALTSEMNQASPINFLITLDDILRRVIAVEGDVAIWQEVISVLRRQTLPWLGDGAVNILYWDRAEDLWNQAGVMVAETAQRNQASQRLQAERQAQLLREINQTLITTFDVDELADVLAEGLPRLGIPGCYLSLYENSEAPTESSKLILAYDKKGRIELDSTGLRFPSPQLAPSGMLPTDRQYSYIVEPLYFRENQLGFVLFETELREGSVYEVLRGEISSALQGALLVERRRQAEEDMAKRAIELELVVRVSAAASTVLDTTELLERIATLTRDSFGLYHAHIYLLDKAGETLVLAAGAGSVGQQMVAEGWNIPYKQEQSLVARAARLKEGIIVNDVLTDPNWLPNPLLPATRSELATPLLVGERVLGVLDVQADEVDRFTKDDIRIQSTLAAQVAVALENARLFEQRRKNLTLTESLYQAGRRITAARNLQEIVPAVAEVTSRGNINRVVLCGFEYDVEGELERMIVQANWHSGEGTPPMLPGTRYPRVMYPGIRQFLGSEPMIFGNIQHDKRFDAMMQKIFQRLNIRAMAALPLWTGTRQTGVLLLQAEEVHQLSEEEIRPYASLMGQVTVAIENQRLLAETNAALAEIETTQRRYTIQAWEAYWARHVGKIGYEETREALTPPGEALSPEVGQTVVEKWINPASTLPASSEKPEELSPVKNRGRGQTDISKDQASLVVPLTVRDEVIGVLGLQAGDEREWAPEEIALVEAIGEQLAQAMENLRLIDETQQRAVREARISEIGEKIQGAQSLEEALQVAIKEVGLSLKAPQTTAQLEVK